MMHHPIFIKTEAPLKKIMTSDIRFLEVSNNYVKIFTTGDMYTVRSTLKNAVNRLPKSQFVQIHRSYVVAIEHITEMGADWLSIGEISLPVTKSHLMEMIAQIPVIGMD